MLRTKGTNMNVTILASLLLAAVLMGEPSWARSRVRKEAGGSNCRADGTCRQAEEVDNNREKAAAAADIKTRAAAEEASKESEDANRIPTSEFLKQQCRDHDFMCKVNAVQQGLKNGQFQWVTVNISDPRNLLERLNLLMNEITFAVFDAVFPMMSKEEERLITSIITDQMPPIQ